MRSGRNPFDLGRGNMTDKMEVEMKDGEILQHLSCGCTIVYAVKHTKLCKKHGDESVSGLRALFG